MFEQVFKNIDADLRNEAGFRAFLEGRRKPMVLKIMGWFEVL